MARFIEVIVESGSVRLLNMEQIAEVSQRDSDGTAILHMVGGTAHPTKQPYADIRRELFSAS